MIIDWVSRPPSLKRWHTTSQAKKCRPPPPSREPHKNLRKYCSSLITKILDKMAFERRQIGIELMTDLTKISLPIMDRVRTCHPSSRSWITLSTWLQSILLSLPLVIGTPRYCIILVCLAILKSISDHMLEVSRSSRTEVYSKLEKVHLLIWI